MLKNAAELRTTTLDQLIDHLEALLRGHQPHAVIDQWELWLKQKPTVEAGDSRLLDGRVLPNRAKLWLLVRRASQLASEGPGRYMRYAKACNDYTSELADSIASIGTETFYGLRALVRERHTLPIRLTSRHPAA